MLCTPAVGAAARRRTPVDPRSCPLGSRRPSDLPGYCLNTRSFVALYISSKCISAKLAHSFVGAAAIDNDDFKIALRLRHAQ